MKRRLATTAAIGLATALAASACSSSKSSGGTAGTPADNSKPVTITLLAPNYGDKPGNDTKDYWGKIAADFHAANPNITVDVQMATWDNLADKVKNAVQTQSAPDLFEGGDYASFAASGLLYKVTDITAPATSGDLIPKIASLGKTKGPDGDGQYGIPFTTSTRAFFYNKTLFQQAGITAAPTTWAEVADDAAKIKKLGKVGYGLPLGAEEAQAETFLWTLGNGGGYKDASGKWAIDQQANVDTFKWLQDNLVKPGLTEPNPDTKNRTDLWQDFAAGNIGMLNGSPALIPILKSGALGDNFGVAQIPGKTGPLASPLGVADFLVAFNTHPEKKAAIGKFLDFALAKQYQEQFDNEYMLLPATQSAATDLSANAQLKPFIDGLAGASFYPFTDPAWTAVSAQVKQIVGKAVTSDPKAVLSQLQQTANKG